MAEIVFLGIGIGAVYGMFAVGLVLVYKTTGVLNFAQGEIGTFSTFIMFVLVAERGLPWILAALIVLACAALIGIVFERIVVRPLIEGARLTLVIATIAGASLLAGIETKVWGPVPYFLPAPLQARGVALGGVVLTPPRLMALGLAAALGAALAVFLKRTTFGLALRAMAQDPVSVRLTGIRRRHLSSFIWGVSAIIGAASGILTALALGAFGVLFMSRVMLLSFAAAVLGGMTSLSGALIGGIGIGMLDAAGSRFFLTTPGAVEGMTFGIILVMLLVRPRGILGRAA